MSTWPRVSVITPSFNQAQYLEKTIRSVILQGYPNLEYIIIDGGSTDGSVDIIRMYEPWLTYWVSEPDKGQAHAINKGFHLASGDIIAWLNSDDSYLPGVIFQAVSALRKRTVSVVYSRCRLVAPDGSLLDIYDPQETVSFQNLLLPWRYHYANPPQPTIFFLRHVLDSVGFLDESLHYVLDYEYMIRALEKFEFSFVDDTWAEYTVHPDSKTGRGWEPFVEEMTLVWPKYRYKLNITDRLISKFAGHRLMIASRYLDNAFEAYNSRDFVEVPYWLIKASLLTPSCLLKRGIMPLFLRSLFALFRQRIGN